MSRYIPIFVVLTLCCAWPLFAEDDGPRFGDEDAKPSQAQAFLDAIPARVEFPEDELKTHIIDAQTFAVARSYDGAFRDYWPDLDILLTESVYEIYYVEGGESRTPPRRESNIWCQGRDYDYRTTTTLWNRATGEKIREVTSDNVYCDMDESQLQIIRRQALLWRSKAGETEVVDLLTGRPVGKLPGRVSFTAQDCEFFVVLGQGNISVHDPQTLESIYTLPGRAFQLSEDRSRLLVWGAEVTVYELKNGKKLHSFKSGDETVLNRDGTKLLIRYHDPEKVELWDVDAGKMCWSAPFGGKDEDGYAFRFSDDGKIVEGDCQMMLPHIPDDHPRSYIWNTQTGEELEMFSFFLMRKGYLGKVNRMFGNIRTGEYSRKYVLCDAQTGERIAEKFTGRFEAASNDETCFLTSEETKFHLWDSQTGKLLRTIPANSFAQYRSSVAFDPEAKLLRIETPVEGLDSRFTAEMVWVDIETGDVVRREKVLPGDENRYNNIVWKTTHENAVFWNLETNQPFFTLRLLSSPENNWRQNEIGPIRFTPDGKEIIYSTKLRPWQQRVIF